MTTGWWSQLSIALHDEIGAIVPDWLAAMFLGRPMAKPLRFVQMRMKIEPSKGGFEAPAELLKDDLALSSTKQPQNVDVFLPQNTVLSRELSVPEAARGKLARLVELDTLQRTPFKREDIYSTFRSVSSEQRTGQLEQWIGKRADIDKLVERLHLLGFRVRKVFVDGVETKPLADFTPRLAQFGKLTRRLNLILVLVGLGLLGTIYLLPTYSDARQLVQMKSQNDALRQTAVALRQDVDASQQGSETRAALFANTRDRLTHSAVLAQLTSAFPEETWISDLLIENDRVRLRGSTRTPAADLVLMLSSDERFEAVSLTGPVARTADGNERFDMVLEMAGTSE